MNKLLYKILIWSGTKLYDIADVYAPNDIVEAITFSNNEEYIDRIAKIEME